MEFKQIKVKVRKKHINKGFRNNCAFCPVALALREQHFETLGNTYVYSADAYSSTLGRRINIPAQVYKFIFDFDRGHKVKPFSFTLDIPVK